MMSLTKIGVLLFVTGAIVTALSFLTLGVSLPFIFFADSPRLQSQTTELLTVLGFVNRAGLGSIILGVVVTIIGLIVGWRRRQRGAG